MFPFRKKVKKTYYRKGMQNEFHHNVYINILLNLITNTLNNKDYNKTSKIIWYADDATKVDHLQTRL